MGRSGYYVKQPGGYSAFIPAPMPPQPPIRVGQELQHLLSQADRALGRLDGSVQTLPDPDLFVFMYVRKEAVLSSQIEGTQSSLEDVLEAEAAISDPDRPRDVGEVINYIRAMNLGLQRLEDLPVSVRLIRDIHAELMRGVRGGQKMPGDLRRSQNWIGPAGSTISDAVFVPPPPHEVPAAMSDLEKFLHDDTPMPVLIRIGVAHVQFETIHPFLDGNGRVGRLLISFLLCERGILRKPVLYLSHYFKKHRATYYDLLQTARDDGDWEAWLAFFLAGVAEVAGEATRTARAIVELRERHRQLITDKFGRVAGNGLRVLETMFHSPIISVSQASDLLGVSFPSANKLVGRLESAGILKEITGRGRNRRYRYSEYVDLFSES
jgi:Fic family protein